MTTSAKTEEAAKAREEVIVQFPESADKEKDRAFSDFVVQPIVNAAVVASEYYTGPFGEQDLASLTATLAEHTRKLESGDLAQCEAMLLGQAHALQAIFVNLARRANKQEYLRQWEAYIRVALKAQSQCRATLETLANIKNPPTVYARQANIAHGPQQVNNAAQAPASHAEKGVNQQNELSGGGSELLPDYRAPQATRRVDMSVEAVDEVDGAEVGGRKGGVRSERLPGRNAGDAARIAAGLT